MKITTPSAGATGATGPAPSGYGIVSVTNGVLDTVQSLGQKCAAIIYGCILGGAVSNAAGSVTTACQFAPTQDTNCIGVKFYWVSPGTSKTLKVSIWNSSGTRLTSDTIVCAATGHYTVTFTTKQAVTAGNWYRVSIWENGGGSYTKATLSTVTNYVPARPFVSGGYVVLAVTPYATGDANPSSTATFEAYPIEPILEK